MRVRADDGRNFSIEKTAHRDFLARRFTVNIDNNILSFLAHLRHRCFHGVKRVLKNRLHERARLHIDHAHFAFGRFQNDRAVARRAFRIIYRAQKPRLGSDKPDNVLLVPDVIAGRDDGSARAQKIDRDLSGDAATAGRVLAIDDREIDPVLFLQLRQPRDHRAAARLANDVAQKKGDR